MAKFPAFCGEHNASKGLDAESACAREVAAFFALANHVSDGLSIVREDGCSAGTGCQRGPLGLKGDEMYADFSKSFYEGFDSSNKLIENPDLVSADGYTAMSAAMW